MIDEVAQTLKIRLKGAMKTLFDNTSKQNNDYTPIIETDFEHEKHQSKLDEKDPSMNNYGDFTDTVELNICHSKTSEIEAAIKESFEKEMKCRIIYPQELMSHISQDVIRMSAAEPCGVNGCVMNILLKEKDRSQKLATVFGNPSTTPTFEIYLTLSEDNCAWKKFQKVFLTIKGCILNNQWTNMPKILSSAYLLEKRRLYRRTSYAVSWRDIM